MNYNYSNKSWAIDEASSEANIILPMIEEEDSSWVKAHVGMRANYWRNEFDSEENKVELFEAFVKEFNSHVPEEYRITLL